MTLVPLAPPPGLDSDDTSFAAQGRWIDASNVRPYNGSLQTIGAFTAVVTLGVGQNVSGFIVANRSQGGIYTIAVGGIKLWSVVAGTPTDITPAGFAANGSYSFAAYGNSVMVSPANGTLYQYTLGGGAASEITQAPDQIRAMLVARRQVLAFGCNEEISTTFNVRCIRGSDIEDPTNWTTSSTNNAFEFILDDPTGIIAARNVGDYVAVWTSTSLWLGTFIGDPQQTYRFEIVTGSAGTTGPDAVCTVGQTAYWLAPDLQIWSWSPGAAPAPVPCPISKSFKDNLDNTDIIIMAAVPAFNEIWLFYNDTRSSGSDPNRYIAFNQEGQWFRGILTREALYTGSGAFLAAHNNIIYQHDVETGTAPDWFLTSADQYMSNGGQRMMIRGIVPDFEDQAGDVSLTIYTKDRPQSTAVTKGPYTLTNIATKKDFRASGKLLSVKFSGSTYVRFGKPAFDMIPMGAR